MDLFHSVVLGVIEGLTEFLPISSTGHLIVAVHLFAIEHTPFVKTFEIAIQLGAILAVVVYFFKTILRSMEVWKKVLVAFVPTALVGAVAYPFIKTYLIGNDGVVLTALFIGGLAIIVIELLVKDGEKPRPVAALTYRESFWVGLFQSLAMIPGVSRSAATILGGRCIGLPRVAIVEFSFLLAVPTMAVATGYDLIKTAPLFSSYEVLLLSVGFVVSFAVALGSIAFFLRFVQSRTLIVFGVYRILAATIFWILLMY